MTRVAIAYAHTPFVHSPVRALAAGLRAACQRRGLDAEIVPVPFTPDPCDRLEAQMLACRLLDVSECEQLVALDFPANLLPHGNKRLWLAGQHGAAYERCGALLGDPALRGAIRSADRDTCAESARVFAAVPLLQQRLAGEFGVVADLLYPPAEPCRIEPADGPLLCLDPRPPPLLAAALRLASSAVPVVVGRPDLLPHCAGAVVLDAPGDVAWPVLDCLAAGKPVVTVETCRPAATLLRHGVTGLVCEADPAALAAALEGLWRNRLRARLMGELAAEAARVLFPSWDGVVEALCG